MTRAAVAVLGVAACAAMAGCSRGCTEGATDVTPETTLAALDPSRERNAPPREPMAGGLEWPVDPNDAAPTDVLVLAPAFGLDPEAVDGATRPLVAAWRRGGAERVFTRARDGQARAVVRFPAGVSADKALAAVRAGLAESPAGGIGPVRMQAVPRWLQPIGAWIVHASAGRIESTRLGTSLVAPALALVPGLARMDVAGRVARRAEVAIDPRYLETWKLDVEGFVAYLRAELARVAGATGRMGMDPAATWVHRLELRRPGAAVVPVGGLLQVSTVDGRDAREARNGQVPVVVVLPWGRAGVDPGTFLMAAGRALADVALPPEVRLVPVHLSHALRVTLGPREPRSADAPEGDDAFGDRLMHLRTLPGVGDVLAVEGHGGVPAFIDLDAGERHIWTVWIVPGGGSTPDAMRAALADALEDPSSPWLGRVTDNDVDVSLAWLYDAWSAHAIVYHAEDPSQLADALRRDMGLLKAMPALTNVSSAPQRSMPTGVGPRFDRALLSEVGARAPSLDAAVALAARPEPVGRIDELPVVLKLAQAVPDGLADRLPVAADGPAPFVPLGGLRRPPDTSPVLERWRVDGRPALLLTADSRDTELSTQSAGLRKLLLRAREATASGVVEALRVRGFLITPN